jgi:glyoxylase-like metal-dependent hydrolase (beta-lactamase superfamily II)
VKYAWEMLAPGVYRCRLLFLDVTVGLVAGSGGVLLIDCGTTLEEADRIADDVRELTGAEVTHLVLTHHHFDHILGSGAFPQAQTYAAAPVAAALSTGIAAVRAHALRYGVRPEALDRAIAALRPPDHVISTADIDLGDRVIRVEHPGRGHTDHDLIVVASVSGSNRVVFCGDLVEESADPVIDGDSDLAAWPATLDRVLAAGGEDGRYVPGHGAVVDSRFLRQQRNWLADRA